MDIALLGVIITIFILTLITMMLMMTMMIMVIIIIEVKEGIKILMKMKENTYSCSLSKEVTKEKIGFIQILTSLVVMM